MDRSPGEHASRNLSALGLLLEDAPENFRLSRCFLDDIRLGPGICWFGLSGTGRTRLRMSAAISIWPSPVELLPASYASLGPAFFDLPARQRAGTASRNPQQRIIHARLKL